MASKTFEEVLERFRQIDIPEEFDLMVAIANGGVAPAGILNQRLQIDLQILRLNYRDPSQKPIYDKPRLLHPIQFEFKNKRILLVEDRIKTGASIQVAKELLKDAAIIRTFAVNGSADYALYDELCFKFPWIL